MRREHKAEEFDRPEAHLSFSRLSSEGKVAQRRTGLRERVGGVRPARRGTLTIFERRRN